MSNFSVCLSDQIEAEVLYNIKRTLSPCISAFTSFFLSNQDITNLKLKFINHCKSCELENEEIRPMTWKILLGVLPSKDNNSLRDWINKTVSDRVKYEQIKRQISISTITSTHSEGDPLSKDTQKWNNFFEFKKLRNLINKDIMRTFQHLPLFKNEQVKEFLSDILFYWCIQEENKQISYRQGMNDVIAVIFLACFPFYFNTKNSGNLGEEDVYSKEEIYQLIGYTSCEDKYAKPLYLFFHDEKFLSHDLYLLFSNLMNKGLRDLYFNDMDQDKLTKFKNENTIKKLELFTNINESFNDYYNDLLGYINKRTSFIYKEMLKFYDEELYEHLLNLKIDCTTFMLRWLRCLFSREFSHKITMQLWDAIFVEEFFEGDSTLKFVDFIALSLFVSAREKLLSETQDGCLSLLFKYPEIESGKKMINVAYKIRSKFEVSNFKFNNKIYKCKVDSTSSHIENAQNKSKTSSTPFQISYNQIENDVKGAKFRGERIIFKINELYDKYKDKIEGDDRSDIEFIINEINEKMMG